MCTGKLFFIKKTFTDLALPLHEVETWWLSNKEIVSGIAVSKEGHAVCLLRHERITDFLKVLLKINSASYSQIIRQN